MANRKSSLTSTTARNTRTPQARSTDAASFSLSRPDYQDGSATRFHHAVDSRSFIDQLRFAFEDEDFVAFAAAALQPHFKSAKKGPGRRSIADGIDDFEEVKAAAAAAKLQVAEALDKVSVSFRFQLAMFLLALVFALPSWSSMYMLTWMQFFPSDIVMIDIARVACGTSGNDIRAVIAECKKYARTQRSNLANRVKALASGLYNVSPKVQVHDLSCVVQSVLF